MEIAHKDYLLSSLLQLLNLLTLLVCLSIETFIFVHKCNPWYHLLPISLTLLLRRALATRKQTYLLDFSCLKPPRRYRVPIAGLLEHLSLINCFDADSVAFMTKVITSSGMGNETYFPPSLHYIPPSATHLDAMREVHMLLFPTLDDLFAKTRVRPLDVDALVINCSGFCPSPSLSAIVVNRYGMRHDIRSFNLSGMGCSAGVVGVDVARTLLSNINRRSYAIVMSTEIVSTGWYNGTDPRKLVLNCFFRMGCSAALVTNRGNKAAAGAAGGRPAKYRLARLLRTHGAQEDRAYRSASREEDAEGITGFSVERDLMRVAAELLRRHAAAVAVSILPWHEKLRYAAAYLRKKAGRSSACGRSEQAPAAAAAAFSAAAEDLVPDFRAAVNHFCLPASGKPMIKKMAAGLGLREAEMEAALMTFHRFGNQSSASMWYQLAYLEAKKRVKKGERVWQLGMGSGPKANTLVWECCRRFHKDEAAGGPWSDTINRYPLSPAAERDW
ncbi:3-ketoacyl-CoA synthase 10-like [Ananas comosus]|uniref:3-ketoacyl-CoA synthase n=1 Tax=Ananas comosus TaxID=4615 RepID=A0A6P5EGG2_ANACO|nr:3-ketoacyl-CoA synthase 10-like [Ananas comosus]